jgi:hypothetical protein
MCGGDHVRVFDQARNQLRGFDRFGAEIEPIQVPRERLAEVTPREFAGAVFPLRQAEVTGGVGSRLGREDSVRLINQIAQAVSGDPAQLAAYLPPFVDFRCSETGTMWLRPLDMEAGGLSGGKAWLRISTAGVSRLVILPERFDALRFTEDRVWGVQRDELDIAGIAWAALPFG